MNPDFPFDDELDPDVVVPAEVISEPQRPVESVEDFTARLANFPPHELAEFIKLIHSENA